MIDTMLGPVTLTRHWYHCAGCGRGLAQGRPARRAGRAMSRTPRATNEQAAAAEPFAKAARPLESLAGVRLTGEHVELAAEASSTAAAPRCGTVPR